jgi:NADPH-dependent 2,4-dienoyl-CoA reductase/sulfur reductase-like enzyme/rhodanese-related sulfurtransferase
MQEAKQILIIGGVAGGASCAARLRRLSEAARIVVFDRGPYVSFANCGLPYYVGDVIRDEAKLLVASAELFRERFGIEVHTEHDVTGIDRAARTITVRALRSGESRVYPYDALVLSPGAAPVRPPIPGIDLDGVFSLRTIPDSRRVRDWISSKGARRALVVGGGFIGLEMAENLANRGLAVTVLEKAAQLMPPLDPEMALPVRERLEARGVTVRLGEGLLRLDRPEVEVGEEAAPPPGLRATTERGVAIATDVVILAIGVRPETGLARAAGIAIGPSGGIAVDETMRTSDPHIWAVGDAVETTDVVTGARQVLPLAGPASRQGRVAAEAICGRATQFRGIQATAVCGAFGLTIAMTGASERTLGRAGITDYDRVYLHPGHHVGYFPGARPIHLKLIFRRSDGRVLGAQAVGEEGVEKRIDVIAMAIQLGASVHDLAEAELCYAPQFGAAKDPVNLAGFIAENVQNGDMPLAPQSTIDEIQARAATEAAAAAPGADAAARPLVLDVREPGECEAGMLPDALNIPLNQLRGRLAELPRDRMLVVYCAVGQRGYYAVRMLRQNGFDARNVSGGYQTYAAMREARLLN